jgi:enoyl-CoA hydratase
VDVRRSYRFEQGFTFEINLSGRADEHRDAFVTDKADKADKKEAR